MNINQNIPPSMQWFMLIIFALCLLAFIGFSIAALFITKNVAILAIPTPLLLAMRPIVRYLFPASTNQDDKK
ncbi:MAG: hypothetical protein ACYDER_11790 [Ktedonobacteraceae bacterium]